MKTAIYLSSLNLRVFINNIEHKLKVEFIFIQIFSIEYGRLYLTLKHYFSL